VDPQNALAWARLAELQASFGYLTQSVESAEKAVALDPNVSRTQTVLGFANLTKVRTQQAKEAFEKAIQLDQADPLPRLGLGLAMIRRGDLEGGRAEIEIAASLDPNNSLIRSYLGKAFFEEKRTDLDGPEFKIAKELDPKDPTPHFYDAIRKQTINQPVEALRDFQKAIELNDNRAVFRSQLKLDADEAARSSSLARIYSDLGFQELALVEGWKSVNTDPTNHSAHRFLADSYASRPRHEIARVSELLQSQLLQPTNTTPIQPRLAESNLFLISAQGPASLSFNEFNPIFNRNGAQAQFSTLAGENDTVAGEFVLSAIQNRLSWSLGYSVFDTDGFRDNADQQDHIANAFVQYELSYKTSIQAEYRYRETEKGDIRQRFFEEDFLLDQRRETDIWSSRVGFRHSFSPDSTLLGNFQYAKKDEDFVDLFFFDATADGFPPPPDGEDIFEIDRDEEDYGAELSYLFRSTYIDLVSGAGYFKTDLNQTFTDTFQWPGTDPPTFIDSFSDPLKFRIDHYNLYAYTYIKPFENLTLTVGGSGDFYEEEEKEFGEELDDEQQFNPKFGVTWNPIPSTTIRGAVFRTFTRTLVTQQTLEPTQVAGFNQFFDDLEATDAWVYGGAVEQKFPKDIYFGAEFSYRDMDVPFIDFDLSTKIANWEEYLGRAYLYWTPHEWLALKAEYQYEKLERDDKFPDGIKDLETHRVPLGINFFHPSGLSAGLTATYYDQDGTIERNVIAFDLYEDGDDDFWLFDAAISYRFPKRYGFASVGVTNLFDENFDYFEVDRNNLRIQQDRQIFFKLTLALP
jgi:Tfp pilus assembly protein PilF